MSTIDITYGESKEIEIDLYLVQYIKLKLKSIEVIKGLLNGTDSDSWLIKAEDNG